jgi:hypothetical protein
MLWVWLMSACSALYKPSAPLGFKVSDGTDGTPINGAIVLVQGYGIPRTLYTDGSGMTPTTTISDGLPFDYSVSADEYQTYTRLRVAAPVAAEVIHVGLSR